MVFHAVTDRNVWFDAEAELYSETESRNRLTRTAPVVFSVHAHITAGLGWY